MFLNLLVEIYIYLLFLRILAWSYWIFLLLELKIFLLINKCLIMKIYPSLVWLLWWLISFFLYCVAFLIFEFNFLWVRTAAWYFIIIFGLVVLWILYPKFWFEHSSALHHICLAAFKCYAFLKFELFIFMSHWYNRSQDHFTEKVFIILISSWICLLFFVKCNFTMRSV